MNKGQKIGIGIAGILIVIIVLSYSVIPLFFRDHYSSATTSPSPTPSKGEVLDAHEEKNIVTHIPTPTPVKGLYMTSCVVGSVPLRNNLVTIASTTEINALVIDIKDFTGTLSFIPEDPTLKEYVSSRCRASDMPDFISLLHSKNIYVIGRITVFQDPLYTKMRPDLAVKRASDGGIWKDRKGISYVDPGAKDVWDHILAISKAAYDIGFDELNYDYIRFPSDGNMSDISFPFSKKQSKPVVLESFFSYLDEHLKEDGIPHSADLFGMTMTNYDDLNIGQVLERTLPYFDFVDPMVYPSHYPSGFNGWKNPNLYPYDLVYFNMKRGATRAEATTSPIHTADSIRLGSSTPALYSKTAWDRTKIRPWLQDFNYGGYYGPKEVREQIQATYDTGLNSWLIWNPSNNYTLAALRRDSANETHIENIASTTGQVSNLNSTNTTLHTVEQ